MPRVSAVLLAIYGPLQIFGFAGEIILIITASYAVMALALSPLDLWLISGTVDEWERPPSFKGFRKIRGTAIATPE